MPNVELAHRLARLFRVRPDYLTDSDALPAAAAPDLIPRGATVLIPIVASVSGGGDSLLARENIIGYSEVPESDVQGGTFFFLQIQDNAMSNLYMIEGSRALVREQDHVEDGAIVVVVVGGQTLVRRVNKGQKEGLLVLEPANPNYKPTAVDEADVRVVGKVIRVEIDVP